MLTIKLTNTSAGLIAIQRALAGEDITFTKLDIGDGVLTNLDISNFTSVINKIKDYPLGVVKPEGQEMVRLRANINNVGITEDKAIREFGLYAKFGSSEQEFLFAYMNTGDIPTALPSSSGGRYDLNRDFVLYIGSSTNVTFDTNGDLVYSTLNDYKALEAQKEDKFPKNSAFNRDFGVAQNQVLEGSKLAEILGIEYGGVLNNNNQKLAGKGYYDTANKKIYKCTTNTSINYADAGYFIEVSNNDLLGKLQNLYKFYTRRNKDLIINISLSDNFCIASFFIEATASASEFYFQTNGTLVDLFSEFGVRIQTSFQGAIGIIQGKSSEAEKLPFYLRCNEDGKLIFVGNSNITGKHGTFGTICFSIRK